MAIWTLSDPVDVVYTALTVCVLAHEMDRRKTELSLAQVTRLLIVEVYRGLLHFSDFRLAVANFGQFLVEA